MGFFDKLKKVLPYIGTGVEVAGNVAASANPAQAGVGAAFNIVNEILNATHHKGNPVAAVTDAAKANAIAIDDHEADIVELKRQIAELTSKLPKQ